MSLHKGQQERMILSGLTIKETVVYFYSPTFHFHFWVDRDPKGELVKEKEKLAYGAYNK